MNIVRTNTTTLAKHIGTALLLIILASCARIPFTMHPEMAASGPNKVSSERCRECHTVIYDEWKTKLHYKALHYISNPDEIYNSSEVSVDIRSIG